MNILKPIVLSVAASIPFLSSGVVTDELTYNWGPADTVAHHKVGPGMTYAKIVFPEKPLILWWVEVDLSNEYAKIEQSESRASVPDVQRWDVMEHYRANSRPGHQVKVAWNHDFFSYEEGVCIGTNISEGEMTREMWGRSLLAITEEGRASVFRAGARASVIASDNAAVDIDYFNSSALSVRGDCVLFNRFNSRTIAEDGRYIALEPLDKWTMNGDDIRCRVIEISDSPLQTAENRYVLLLRGGKRAALDGHVSAGDIISVRQGFHAPAWGEVPQRILNAFHGYPSIVSGGALQDGEYNDFENGREHEKSSRVMAGISADKTRLYITTTEMSGASVGVDCIELAAWMVEKGASDVVNFDSGGSAAIVIDEQMLNVPGRGSVRPVKDAVLAVSTAPADANEHHITFSRPSFETSVLSLMPLKVMVYNRYDELLEEGAAGCEFECRPAGLGTVDANGGFHASGTPMHGTIVARRNGMEAVIEVNTVALESMKAVREAILIDDRHAAPIEIKGISGGLEREVDPTAFEWSFSPEGVATLDADGNVTGVATGTTRLTGVAGGVSVGIDVAVEIAEGDIAYTFFNDLEAAGIKFPSYMTNAAVSYDGLPAGWTSGAVINFDLAQNRSGSLGVTPRQRFYSLPSGASMRMYDKNGAVKTLSMLLEDATGKVHSFKADTSEGEHVYTFDFKDSEGRPFAYYQYPLELTKITLGFNASARQDCELALESVKIHFTGSSSVEFPTVQGNGALDIRINGGCLMADMGGDASENATLTVYNSMGQPVYQRNCQPEAGRTCIVGDISHLPSGMYIAVVRTGSGNSASAKFVK